MARQYRMNSLDIYDKLCVKIPPTSPEKKRSANIFIDPESVEIGEGFYLTEKKTYRVKSAEVVKRVENGLVNFEKQLPRPDFNIHAPPAHENRFVKFNDCPSYSTKHRPVNSPRFSLYLGRTKKDSPEQTSEYSPKFNAVERDTKKGLVPFAKTLGRIQPKKEANSSHKIVRLDYSVIDPHVASLSMEKSPPRSIAKDLPLFMANTGYRGGDFSHKALVMNQYMESKFLPLTSGFGKKWSQEGNRFPIPIKGRCPKIVKILKEKLLIA